MAQSIEMQKIDSIEQCNDNEESKEILSGGDNIDRSDVAKVITILK